MCLQRWLNLVLDLLVAGLAIAVVALAVVFRADITGAQVGIALNMMLVANKTLLKLMESWTTLETSLGAIARIQMLEKMTPVEGRISVSVQPAIWPSKGRLELRSISASYRYEHSHWQHSDLKLTEAESAQRLYEALTWLFVQVKS